MVKCPKCDAHVSSVEWEVVSRSPFVNVGSNAFVAVANPCKHVIPAVPTLWEGFMKQILEKLK